ncbi:MAG: phenylacetate--CoA ligase family protein [Fibrobacteria bacterium]|nr:phenylacetate--CoA ligase family protein [Fibrobacteria bacterium]
MNSTLAGNILYPLIQFLRKEPVLRIFHQVCKSQHLSKQELEQLQMEKLKNILIHAYEHVPLYYARFKSCNFNPYNFRNKKELLSIPYLTKQDIIQHTDALISTKDSGPFATETTSGSTGKPMRFQISRNYAAAFRAAKYREHSWFNIGIGDKEARFYGIPLDTSSRWKESIKDFLMNRKRFSVFKLGDKYLQNYIQQLRNYKPAYIYGYASAIFRFSEYIQRCNQDPGLTLKAVITTSEVLHDSERDVIEKVWKCPVVNEYGSSETGIIAHSCAHKNMHLVYENNYLEFIENNTCVPENKTGEIVITNLDNERMPLIRYKIGDAGSYSNTSCSCGCALPLIKTIEGRLNNMVMTVDGKVSSGLVFYYIARSLLKNKSNIKQFRITQKAINHIHFSIIKGEKFSESSITLLKEKTRKTLNKDLNITFEYLDALPKLKNGKRLHFISELDFPLAGTQR